MTPSERLELVNEMNESLRRIQLAEIREAHPDADSYELKMRLASRWLSPRMMKAAFNWDVDEQGY